MFLLFSQVRDVPDCLLFVIWFPHVIKTLMHGFNPYNRFYLPCKCSTFLGVHTHRNTMKHSDLLLKVQKEKIIYERSSALTGNHKRFTAVVAQYVMAFAPQAAIKFGIWIPAATDLSRKNSNDSSTDKRSEISVSVMVPQT